MKKNKKLAPRERVGGAKIKKRNKEKNKKRVKENVFSFTLFLLCGRIIMYDYA